jgi:glutamine amidotransferase
MQLLFDESEEFGLHRGLGILPGRVIRFPPPPSPSGSRPVKFPHIGWNNLLLPEGVRGWQGSILAELEEGVETYFVHSFVAVPREPGIVLAQTEYGGSRVTAAVSRGKVSGCQFHPEKSREAGLAILRAFAGGIA